MAWTVALFEAPPPDANGRSQKTERKPDFMVEGKDFKEARNAAKKSLEERGFTVRSINQMAHPAGHPTLVATVNAIVEKLERPKATVTPRMLRK
jgi:hypothetical protein